MNGLVPKKQSVALAMNLADRTKALLRIWDYIDFDDASTKALAAILIEVAPALRKNEHRDLAAQIRTPAARADIVRATDDLLAAFALRKDVDLRDTSRLLAEEILADRPFAIALREGVRELIRTAIHPPVIAEVLTAIAERQTAWAAKARLLDELPRRASEALVELRRRPGGAPPGITRAGTATAPSGGGASTADGAKAASGLP